MKGRGERKRQVKVHSEQGGPASPLRSTKLSPRHPPVHPPANRPDLGLKMPDDENYFPLSLLGRRQSFAHSLKNVCKVVGLRDEQDPGNWVRQTQPGLLTILRPSPEHLSHSLDHGLDALQESNGLGRFQLTPGSG